MPSWHGVGPGQGGAELGAPADPTENYSAARPEWYFLFLFQFLKYFPGESEIIGAMVIPGVIMARSRLTDALHRDRWKLGHRFNVVIILGILIGIGVLTTSWRWNRGEPANAGLHLCRRRCPNQKAERVKELAQIQGIGSSGAVQLLRDDPKTRGAALFKAKCASCHRYNGRDGTDRTPVEVATASDLGTFGTRDWIRGLLTDPAGPQHFGPTKNSADVGDRFTEGQMAKWVQENVATKQVSDEELDAVVEFLASLSELNQLEKLDDGRIAQGRTFFAQGSDAVSTNCYDCHAMKVAHDPDGVFADGSAQIATGAPDLTGSGSAAWLREFIGDPGSKKFYSSHNAMPAFAGSLTEHEINLIVDWLLHDWPEAKHKTEKGAPVW